MARKAKSSGSQDLIGRISDTIASHPRLSAAAAFQMGVLLGQVMQNAGTFRGIGRKMAAAPGAIASSIPTFGLFESGAITEPRAAARRGTAKRSQMRGTRRRKRAAHA